MVSDWCLCDLTFPVWLPLRFGGFDVSDLLFVSLVVLMFRGEF